MKNLLGLAVISTIILVACTKSGTGDNEAPNSNFRVKLTDAPYDAQQVNVDIREVRINYTNDTLPWTTLQTNARVYDLLKLQNGRDTVLSSATLPGGTINQIRFILGPNNTIMIDSVIYPLSIASGDESGLKININKKLRTGMDSVLIDFDAEKSIIKTGNGQYRLKPVLKLK
jgi:hypothetical protein